MEITFKDKKLAKLVNDDRRMFNELGKQRSTLLKRRLTQLSDAETLEDVRYLAGNFHELIKNRKGQWSCDLDQPFRLVFQPQHTPIPTDKDGKYIWTEITTVEIIEIVDYH